MKVNFKYRLLMLTTLFFSGWSILLGQNVAEGIVSDENGEPLVGVSVLVQGTATGTITDLDGRFQLTVPEPEAILVVSYIGYLTQEIDFTPNSQFFEISMTKDVTVVDPPQTSSPHIVAINRPIKTPKPKKRANEVGAAFRKRFNLLQTGAKKTEAGKDIYYAEFSIQDDPNLGGVYLMFSKFYVPFGELKVYDVAKNQTELVPDQIKVVSGRKYLTEIITGNNIRIEYSVPAGTDVSEVKIKICAVGYYYKSGMGQGDASDNCFINTACMTLDNLELSVIRWDASHKINTRRFNCTGVIIDLPSGVPGSRGPLLLTAKHCIKCRDMETAKVFFKYQTTACDDTTERPDMTRFSLVGLNVLAKKGCQDLVLMELYSTPPDSFQLVKAGWDFDGAGSVSGAEVIGIHHSRGGLKSVSVGTFEGKGSSNFYKVTWDDESSPTEVGASGSPIFQDGKVVGILSRGNASCDVPDGLDKFGKLRKAWGKFGQFLGNGSKVMERQD
jgi:hypothetical protein